MEKPVAGFTSDSRRIDLCQQRNDSRHSMGKPKVVIALRIDLSLLVRKKIRTGKPAQGVAGIFGHLGEMLNNQMQATGCNLRPPALQTINANSNKAADQIVLALPWRMAETRFQRQVNVSAKIGR